MFRAKTFGVKLNIREKLPSPKCRLFFRGWVEQADLFLFFFFLRICGLIYTGSTFPFVLMLSTFHWNLLSKGVTTNEYVPLFDF
jgi:hypothetical protein